jgi:peptide/nickel transport system substrate-binding protein
LEKNPALEVFSIASFGHKSLDMQTDAAPFDNLQVRQALKYAIDRESILRIQQHGYGKLGNDHPISPLDPFYAADIPQRPYDPEKAKFLLNKASFSGEITLSVADAAFIGAIDMAQIFQAGAAKAGINLQVKRVPDDGYYSKVWNSPSYPFVGSFWSGRPTPSLMFTHAYASTSFSNSSHWKNPKFDQMLLAARAEFAVVKRRQIYHDMQFMLHEEGGALIPMFINYIDAGQKKVKGFIPFPVYEMSGLRAAEKVWLEE